MCKSCNCATCQCHPRPALPADWALNRAGELYSDAGGVSSARDYAINRPNSYPAFLALARYIEQHEEPPVDPALVAAREHLASISTGPVARNYRDGRYDGIGAPGSFIQIFLAGAAWGRANPAN
jgi:hypothetical protein